MFYVKGSQNFNYFFFKMLVMDGCSKNSNNIFYKTPKDDSGWMKRKR